MGSKPSNNFQMDRPESGGADRKAEREASGLLDRAKEEFAEGEKRKIVGEGTRRRGDFSGAAGTTGERPSNAPALQAWPEGKDGKFGSSTLSASTRVVSACEGRIVQ